MVKEVEQIWVCKDFKRLMKQKAFENDSSILKLTEQLASDDDFKNWKRKKYDWRF